MKHSLIRKQRLLSVDSKMNAADSDNWEVDDISQQIRQEFIKDSLELPLNCFSPIRPTGPKDGKLRKSKLKMYYE